MVQVQEEHGLVKCIGDHQEAGSTQSTWTALEAGPYWFFSEDSRKVEAEAVKTPKYCQPLDFIHVKHQLDALFLRGEYPQGLALAKQCYLYHGEERDVKRELVDLMAQFAIKCNDQTALDECLRWLNTYATANDTGILWLRIRIAQGKKDVSSIQTACQEYLRVRPDEAEVKRILSQHS